MPNSVCFYSHQGNMTPDFSKKKNKIKPVHKHLNILRMLGSQVGLSIGG